MGRTDVPPRWGAVCREAACVLIFRCRGERRSPAFDWKDNVYIPNSEKCQNALVSTFSHGGARERAGYVRKFADSME